MIKTILPVLLFFIISCSEKEAIDEQSATEGVQNTAPNTLVSIDTATTKPFFLFIESSGKIRAHKDVVLKAKASGQIEYANLKAGMPVSKGQLLIRLDQREAKLKVQSAEIAYQKAQLDFESNLIGYPKLLAQQNPEQDSLYQKLKIASGLQENAIRLQETRLQLSQTEIRAPFSGNLYDVNAFAGKQVNVGDELLSIFNKKLLIETLLLENEAINLKEGMPAEIRSADLDKSFAAKVFSINPKVDENGLVTVQLLLNSSESLWPGMNVKVRVKVPKGNRLQVPKNSLVLRSGKAVVFSLEEDLAKWNYVEYGLENGEWVEIKEGIGEGTVVVSSNNLQLAHDAPITVEKQAE